MFQKDDRIIQIFIMSHEALELAESEREVLKSSTTVTVNQCVLAFLVPRNQHRLAFLLSEAQHKTSSHELSLEAFHAHFFICINKYFHFL